MLKRLTRRLESQYGDAADNLREWKLWVSLLALTIATVVYIPGLFLLASPLTGLQVAGLLCSLALLAASGWLLASGSALTAARLQAFGLWAIVSAAFVLPGGALIAPLAGFVLLALVLTVRPLERSDALILTGLYVAIAVLATILQGTGVIAVTGSAPVMSGMLLALGCAVMGGVAVLSEPEPQPAAVAPLPVPDNDDVDDSKPAEATFPLRYAGRGLGTLRLWQPDEGEFSNPQHAAFQTLADQVAAAIHGQHPFSEASTLGDFAQPLYRLMRDLTTVNSTAEVITALRGTVLPTADHVSIVRTADALDGVPDPADVSAWDQDPNRAQAALPAAISALGTDTPVLVNSRSETAGAMKIAMQSLDAATMALIPLVGAERIGGHLVIAYREERPFSEGDVEMLRILSGQLAPVVDRLRLLDRLQTSLGDATTLYSTSLALNAAQNLDEVYDTALSEMSHFGEADRITLFLSGPDPRGEATYLEAVAVWEGGRMVSGGERQRYVLNEAPVLSQFPHSRANLVFNKAQDDLRLEVATREHYGQLGVGALAMVPLATGTTWLGAFLFEGRGDRTFTDDQIRLSRNIADQAALAIDLQLLLARSHLAADRERGLREVIDHIRMAVTPEEIDGIVERELPDILGHSPDTLQRARAGEADLLTADDWSLVTTVDTQANLAASNIRLLERTQQAIENEQMISDITARLQGSIAVDDVLETAVQALKSVLSEYDVALRLTPGSPAALPASNSHDDAPSS